MFFSVSSPCLSHLYGCLARIHTRPEALPICLCAVKLSGGKQALLKQRQATIEVSGCENQIRVGLGELGLGFGDLMNGFIHLKRQWRLRGLCQASLRGCHLVVGLHPLVPLVLGNIVLQTGDCRCDAITNLQE